MGAMIFWFFNALNKEYNTRINYPLQFIYAGTNLIEVNKLPDQVRLDVSGGGWNLLRKTFWFNISPIIINLENPTEIKYLTNRDIQEIVSEQFEEVQLNSILTDTLFIDIEPKVQRKLPISLEMKQVKLEENYRISGPIRFSIDSILLEGPKSLVNNLTDTFMISLSNNKINQNYSSDVELKPFVNQLIDVNPKEVKVSFEVDHYVAVAKEVDVTTINFPQDSSFSLSDSSVTLFFKAPEKKLANMNNDEFRVVLNYNRMTKDSTLTPELAVYPDYVENIRLDSSLIKVDHGAQ
jgi:hypothetical protein